MDFPKVSIITVVFNSAKLLQRTINSVRQLTYPNVEYVIVDGNSTDSTKEIIERNYLHITRWISEPDKGIYDAMNKALGLSTGDFVWFINAGDTIYDPYILDNIFKGKEKFADIYYGETIITNEEGEELGLRVKKLPKKLTWLSFRHGMTVCHQSIIVRRKLAPKYNTEYRFSADFDWVIRILKQDGVTTYNTRRILSIFQEGGATTKNHKKSLKERWHIMVKYYGFLSTLYHHILFLTNIFKPKYRKKHD